MSDARATMEPVIRANQDQLLHGTDQAAEDAGADMIALASLTPEAWTFLAGWMGGVAASSFRLLHADDLVATPDMLFIPTGITAQLPAGVVFARRLAAAIANRDTSTAAALCAVEVNRAYAENDSDHLIDLLVRLAVQARRAHRLVCEHRS